MSASLYIGVAANWWNPVGWLGTAAIGTVGIACGSYWIYRALTYSFNNLE